MKNEKSGRVYWASDSDWSINIDSVELDDASLYQCDIKTGSREEKLLVELIVDSKWSRVLHDLLHAHQQSLILLNE